MEKTVETPIAKLRNQLTPIYGLVDMVLMIDAKIEMKELCIEEAERCIKNSEKIKPLLTEIESQIELLTKQDEEHRISGYNMMILWEEQKATNTGLLEGLQRISEFDKKDAMSKMADDLIQKYSSKQSFEFVNKEAVEFAEWIDENDLVFMGWDRWESTNKECTIKAKTTEELYKLFKSKEE